MNRGALGREQDQLGMDSVRMKGRVAILIVHLVIVKHPKPLCQKPIVPLVSTIERHLGAGI